jgi:predicted transcriptional regulator
MSVRSLSLDEGATVQMAIHIDSRTPPNGRSSLTTEEVSEMVDLLKQIGVHGFAAKILIALSTNGPSSSSELQKLCKLRQPEVSIGITRLKKDRIIQVEKIVKLNRGRPKHVYLLNGGFYSATLLYREKAASRIKEMNEQLGRLNELSEQMRALSN